MQLPDYQGGSIVNLMASLQAGLDGRRHDYPPLTRLPPEWVREHRQVLLLVVDGLGLDYLRAHPEAGCLNAHLRGGMTSVFPPTTATAVTTFLTGEAPRQHGLTGWHMYLRELGSVLAILPARPRYGGPGPGETGVDLRRVLHPRPFADHIGVAAYTVSPAFIAESDFNRAHLGGAQAVAYRDLGGMLAHCARLLRSPGRKYVYAYWPDLDSLGHRFGIWSEAARGHLLELDRALESLLNAIRGTDTLVVLCADHGQIDPPAERRIELGDHPVLEDCLVLPLCGEPRTAYCYLRPGTEDRFDDYVRQELDGVLDSLTASTVMESAMFGLGEPHPRLLERIGDRVLVMRDDYVIKDWLPQEQRYEMIGVHGGLSQEELWVPLVVAES